MKSNLSTISSRFWPIGLIGLLVILAYWRLPQTFYQQDEWQILGHNLVQGWENVTHYTSPVKLLFGEGRPLVRAANVIFFGGYRFTVAPILWLAILMHIINAWLLYRIVERLTQRRVAALVASLFFALNAVSQEAVTWAAAFGTLPATALILAAIESYLVFLERKRAGYLWLAFGLALISLYFKEIGIFLFILFPLLYWLSERERLSRVLQVNAPFLTYVGLALMYRLAGLFTANPNTGTFIASDADFKAKVLMHLIVYPLTGVFQTLLPSETLYAVAKRFNELMYPSLAYSPVSDLVHQTVTADLLAVVGSLVLIGLVIAIARRQTQAPLIYLSLALFLTLLSFLPYAVLERGGSYLDSRYYYVAVLGVGMLIGYLASFVWRIGAWSRLVLVVALTGLLTHHFFVIRQTVADQVKIGDERRTVLEQIKAIRPSLGQRSVFYVESNKDYYVDRNPLPFQQGVGYTMLVWYAAETDLPKEFFNDNFLWDLGSQGYREIEGHGFGYFYDRSAFLEAVQYYQLAPHEIIAVRWNAQRQQFQDISTLIAGPSL